MSVIKEYFQTIKIYNGRDREVKVSIKTTKENGFCYINESDNIHGDIFEVYSKSERRKLFTAWNKGHIDCIGITVEVSCDLFMGVSSLHGVFVSTYDHPNKACHDLLYKCCNNIDDTIETYHLIYAAIEDYKGKECWLKNL